MCYAGKKPCCAMLRLAVQCCAGVQLRWAVAGCLSCIAVHCDVPGHHLAALLPTCRARLADPFWEAIDQLLLPFRLQPEVRTGTRW